MKVRINATGDTGKIHTLKVFLDGRPEPVHYDPKEVTIIGNVHFSRPSRLALYGRLIEKKLNLSRVAENEGLFAKSASYKLQIQNILTRMQREENNQ